MLSTENWDLDSVVSKHLFDLPGFNPETPLVLYEEIKPDFVEKINNYNDPLEKVLFIGFILSEPSLV